MDHILIDTDVILDFFLDRLPFSEHASKVLSLCESNVIKGYITPVICSNSYYILRQYAKHEKVIEKLKQLLTFVDILEMDRVVVKQAMVSEFEDFEDALQHFSAVKCGSINIILTRNLKDFVKSEILVLNPESYLEMIADQ